MKVYVYRGDVYCEHCAGELIRSLAKRNVEYSEDSDRYPKGPYYNGGGEADYPKHCAKCNTFLENPLTSDGIAYVRDAIARDIRSGKRNTVAIKVWWPFYSDLLDYVSAVESKWPIVSSEVEDRFNKLAEMQRGTPELMMLRIQDSGISQMYGYVAEHVGDILHRMSYKVNSFHGGYELVCSKVSNTLNLLRGPYGFMREIHEQINRNIEFHKRVSDRWWTKFDDALAELMRLGRNYAEAYRNLPVYNEAQDAARNAAIAIGEFRFDDAQRYLEWIEERLNEGPYAWAAYAMKS